MGYYWAHDLVLQAADVAALAAVQAEMASVRGAMGRVTTAG